jgi:phosphate transport system substrate-binding protein
MKIKLIGLVLTLSVGTIFTPTAQAANLQGSGSSFASNFIEKCKVAYASTGNTINYTPNGSGSGKNQFSMGVTDFAISDTPYGLSETKPSRNFVYVPIVAGPIAISYKLDGYTGTLKLTKDNLAKIFAGKITTWNDPLLKKDNPGKLPGKKITVIYRADGSGTSEIFTTYLNAVAKDVWNKPGNKAFATTYPGNINERIGYFISAAGSQGVSLLQSKTDGSIAYNEVSYTTDFKVAYVENGAGRFLKPTANGASRFLSDFVVNPNGTITPNYNNPNKMAYNISTFSYGIAPIGSKDIAKFFTFAITKCKAAELGYSPISGDALKLAKSQISKIG